MTTTSNGFTCDFAEVRGQSDAIGAVVEAVATRRPLLLQGPPGVGKTMIARRIPTILPALSALESAWIRAEHEGLGMEYRTTDGALAFATGTASRPFRAPHHTVSAQAMTGARVKAHTPSCPAIPTMHRPRPTPCTCGHPLTARAGECDLARFGVLYLDEVPEFTRQTAAAGGERLRRMGATAPLLVASAARCPCGWQGAIAPARECTCTDEMIERWQARQRTILGALSGEAWIVAEVRSMGLADLRAGAPGPTSASLRDAVAKACAS
jgi:magnesium chelatase family protein